MEINTLTTKEYEQNSITENLREIFSKSYVTPKKQSVLESFYDIKTKMSGIFENILNLQNSGSLQDEINDKFLELDFGSEYDIDASKIGVNDAIFFVNLLNQENLINYSVEDNSLSLTTSEGKKINATNSLLNMLQTSFDTKKPIRLDFDKDVTVVLKLDNNGKIQAHFIPGNSEVENYLKNNLSSLKQTFDDEEINYSYLGYSKYKEDNKNSKKQKRSS